MTCTCTVCWHPALLERWRARALDIVVSLDVIFFFFQAEDGIRDDLVTGVQTCALPICCRTRCRRPGCPGSPAPWARPCRSEERRVGKSVDLGGRRIIKKKKKKT